MSTTDQFLPGLYTYPEKGTELQQGEHAASHAQQALIGGSAEERTIPLPARSLVLGQAEDGLSLMLDIYDPAIGPLLIAGDGGSGKTALLRSIAQASDNQDPGDIQFGVITPFPEEWTDQETLPNCLGIWPAFHPAAKEFLLKILNLANVLQGSHQLILVMVDGLDLLTAGGSTIQHELRCLLMIGPRRQILPVVTINPGRLAHLETWLGYFNTSLLGQVDRPQTACLLFKDSKIDLAELEAGKQFCLPRLNGCLKFRLSSIGKRGCHERRNAVV
jgi:hypothetical protein